MRRTPVDEWLPSGVDELEQAAWAAVRASRSAYVVAGPGAGKTELLAQRATFLLQTGQCSSPFRILAISFKRDAAENLQSRVQKRCPPQLSRRFTSVTFDAFTKSIVDRFALALPPRWRLPNGYGDIAIPTRADVKGFLSRHSNSAAFGRTVAAMDPVTFESTVLGQWRLQVERASYQGAEEFAADWWWFENLRNRAPEPANLSFTMLNRLAELILRHNPLLLRALRHTYPYVFIDECQDTTYAQYDFLLSVFGGVDGVCVTAVGDDKQRIMGWAGAVPDVFARLGQDFGAERIQLLCNYRSSPELVRIQHVLAQALDSSVEEVQSRQVAAVDVGDAARIWCLDSMQNEARHLAEYVSNDMTQRAMRPRDYGLLVRQRAEDFEPVLANEFARVGLRVRNEAQRIGRTTVQDLVVEPLAVLHLGLLRLATRKRDRDTWVAVAETMRHLRGDDPDAETPSARIRKVAEFVRDLRKHLSSTPVSADACEAVLRKIDEFIDLGAVARAFPTYRTGDALAIAREAMQLHLANSTDPCQAWADALDAFEGTDSVPLMTVHKSKGLEFDTMVMIGLDDKTWWSYTPDNPEGLATFFVAVSRAKQRIVITHCSRRGSRAQVAPLFDLLRTAGVPETDLTVPALSRT